MVTGAVAAVATEVILEAVEAVGAMVAVLAVAVATKVYNGGYNATELCFKNIVTFSCHFIFFCINHLCVQPDLDK